MNITKNITAVLFLAMCFTAAFAQDSTVAKNQTVRGVIIDAQSNSPINGATVTIQNPGKKTLGAVSNSKGVFRIVSVPLGRVSLRVSMVGYDVYYNDNVLVTAGKEVVLEIQLSEKFSKVQDIEVVYDRSLDDATTNNEFASLSARAFNLEDTKRYAGSLGDPSRMAQNFAGVVGANDSRNDIVVRGNSPAGMLWQMEGMNIPNPNHFGSLSSTGGPVSILNNNVLAKSDFFTSAFPSMYGNAISGAFDLRMRDGNTEKSEFVGQVGFNGFELGAEGPAWNQSSYLINYRYSTLGVFKALGINFGTGSSVPDYQDINVRFKSRLDDNSTLTFFGSGGMSDVSFLGNDIDTNEINLYGDPDRNVFVNYKTGWAGISYDNVLSESTYLKATLGISGTDEGYQGDSLIPSTRVAYRDEDASLTTTKYSAVASIKHKFTGQTSMIAGLIADYTNYSFFRKEKIGTPAEVTNVDAKDNATLTQAYVQIRTRLTETFTLNGGLHSQYYTLGSAFAFEPRIGVTAQLTPSMSLSAGYGLHSQAQNAYVYSVLGNSELNFTRSHHTVLSYDWFLSDAMKIKIEGYYQTLFDVPVEQNTSSFSLINSGAGFAPSNETNLINKGSGTNVGAELTIEHFFRDGFYFLATASVFDSKYKGSDGIERNTAYNNTYVANILCGKEFELSENSVLALNIKVSTTGGRFLTPIDLQASAAQGSTVFNTQLAFSERQKSYFRADIKLAYRVNFTSSTMEFALDLQNVTNNENVFLQSFNRRTGGITTEYQQAFFPVPTFRYTF